MKFGFKLSRICGSVHTGGNIAFLADGNSVVTAVGSRVVVVDIVKQSTHTMPFENKSSVRRIAVSANGKFLVTIDRDGHALFVNLPRKVVLQRIHFRRKVRALVFSPDSSFFAVTNGRGVQIWRTPRAVREFAPLNLYRTLSGHHDDTTCVDWSSDSKSIVMGSMDLTARVFSGIHSKRMAMTVLTGHRGRIIAAFFSQDNKTIYSIAQDGAVFTWVVKEEESAPSRKRDRKATIDANRDVERAENEDAVDDSAWNEDMDEVEDGFDREGVDIGDEEEPSSSRSTRPPTRSRTHWELKSREFLWEHRVEISSAALNKPNSLLVVGFTNGVFALYEMPGCVSLHRLSVSTTSIQTVQINCTGEWLALASSQLGQLLVWEWQSETYVMKQQGHLHGLNTLAFSSDGHFVATGGEDHKVKLWSTTSGFCFVTFSAHTAPVTAVAFAGRGSAKAIISASLDGTVRAHDLIRYRNFRTMTTPDPAQFTSVAVDASGEVVCAGALEPFNIFVWSLQTGRLLDVLSGHESPISSLDFSHGTPLLASGSWDGTLKLWDVYKNTCVETFEHGTDVLAVAFRPDGKQVCSAVLNGNLCFYDVEEGILQHTIEGRRDIAGGRLSTDSRTAENSTRSKHFTSVCYSPDGTCVLAGGRSKFACIYAVEQEVLVKKFQLSHNRSLEGIDNILRSDRLTEGGAIGALDVTDSEGEDLPSSVLPGARKGANGARITRPEISCSCLRFSGTGREWACATPEGLLIYSLEQDVLFDPLDIDESITPKTIEVASRKGEHGRAVSMALHLGEQSCIKEAVDAVPYGDMPLVSQGLHPHGSLVKSLMTFLAAQLGPGPDRSRHVEYYLQWCKHVLLTHAGLVLSDGPPFMDAIRDLLRALTHTQRDLLPLLDQNQYILDFITVSASATEIDKTDGPAQSYPGLNERLDAAHDDNEDDDDGGQWVNAQNYSELTLTLPEDLPQDLPQEPSSLTNTPASKPLSKKMKKKQRLPVDDEFVKSEDDVIVDGSTSNAVDAGAEDAPAKTKKAKKTKGK